MSFCLQQNHQMWHLYFNFVWATHSKPWIELLLIQLNHPDIIYFIDDAPLNGSISTSIYSHCQRITAFYKTALKLNWLKSIQWIFFIHDDHVYIYVEMLVNECMIHSNAIFKLICQEKDIKLLDLWHGKRAIKSIPDLFEIMKNYFHLFP